MLTTPGTKLNFYPKDPACISSYVISAALARKINHEHTKNNLGQPTRPKIFPTVWTMEHLLEKDFWCLAATDTSFRPGSRCSIVSLSERQRLRSKREVRVWRSVHGDFTEDY